jgi:hypothetical protein
MKGLECVNNKRFYVFDVLKCAKSTTVTIVNPYAIFCDLLGNNPAKEICPQGYQCFETKNYGVGECLRPTPKKKQGESCDILGIDTEMGICEKGLKCISQDGVDRFEPGICQVGNSELVANDALQSENSLTPTEYELDSIIENSFIF